MPSEIRESIERINALRNAIAHSYTPENRRQYKGHKAVVYQKTDIFSKEGVTKFLQDAIRVLDYLVIEAYGVTFSRSDFHRI